MLVHERRQDIKAGLVGHDDVHQDHVGLQVACLEHRLAAGRGLADRLDVLLLPQQQLQAGADDSVVVDDQHANGCGHGQTLSLNAAGIRGNPQALCGSRPR